MAHVPEQRTGYVAKVYQNAAGEWHAVVVTVKPKAMLDASCRDRPLVGQTLTINRVGGDKWVAR